MGSDQGKDAADRARLMEARRAGRELRRSKRVADAEPIADSAVVQHMHDDWAAVRRYKEQYFARLGSGDGFETTNASPSPRGETSNDQGPVVHEGQEGTTESVASLTKRMGLNSVKTFYWEDAGLPKFGDTTSQLGDCRDLGARVLRQPGHRDLLWGMVAHGQPVPLEGDLAALVVSPSNVGRYAEMLKSAYDAGTKVVLTFLNIGGGTDASILTDPDGEMRDAPILEWSRDHLGQSIDGYDFESTTTSRLGFRTEVWLLHTLDPRSGYKRAFLALVATHVGELLNQAMTELQKSSGYATAALSDIVEGIEIFNEIDARAMIFDSDGRFAPMMSAYYWALCYAQCAVALRATLGPDVALLLPGISSYHDGVAGRTWDDEYSFFQTLLICINWAGEWLLGGVEIGDIAQGVDYHWYHRHKGELRHIGYLVEEVKLIREALDDIGLGGAPVTVFETGVSLDDPTPATSVVPEVFQSDEVWRRLGGVLASPARVAGWHSFMSWDTENFAAMGLREDDQPSKSWA
ncbi:MAG: hypothetical protein Q8Q29_01045, partial [Actinomycetota bacterium]|nr:hypothetical protein [Actinomycetota bacterium]